MLLAGAGDARNAVHIFDGETSMTSRSAASKSAAPQPTPA